MNSRIKCLNRWDVQSKHVLDVSGISDAIYAGECRYGGGEKYVLYDAYQHYGYRENKTTDPVTTGNSTIRGDTPIVCVDKMGCKSEMVTEANVSNSLDNADSKHPQVVCYGISAYNCNAMKSSNPHSGIYEATTSRTLDLNGGNPACNQGGMIVVCYDARGNGEGGVSPTITGDHENRVTDYTAVVCYSQTSFAQYAEQNPLLRASGGDLGGGQRRIDFDRSAR